MHEAFKIEKVWKAGKHEKSLIYMTEKVWKFGFMWLAGRGGGAEEEGSTLFFCLCYDRSTSISIFDHNWRHSGFIILF